MRLVAFKLVSVFILSLLLSHHQVFAARQIELVTIDYPPLQGYERDKNLMNELLDAVFHSLEMEVSYTVYPMSRIPRDVALNKVDGAVGSSDWFYQHDLQNPVYFISFHDLQMKLFYLRRRFPQGLKFEGLEELQDYSIGYLRGGSLLPLFAEAKLQPDLVRHLKQNVKKVYTGRNDMFAAVDIGGWATIRKLYPSEVNKFAISQQEILTISSNLILSQRNADLVPLVEQALQALIDSGEYQRIAEKYYPSPLPHYIESFIHSPVHSFSSEELAW